MASYDDTGTVSGNIVRVNDGADSVPLKNWQVTLPANLSGYSEVNGVKSGKNLFDKTTITPNSIIGHGTGVISSNNSYFVSDYIPVKAGMVVYFTGFNYWYQSYYNSNKELSSSIPSNTAKATIPSGVGWLRVSGQNTNLDTAQLEIGESASAYEIGKAPTQYTSNLGRTIYGGTADVVNGTGTDGFIKYVIDGVNNYAINVSGTNFNIMPYGLFIDGTVTKWVCDAIPASGTNFGYNSSQGFIFIRQAGWSSLTGVTDVASFNAYCQQNPITLILPKTAAEDFTFTPITAETALGSNNFWSDQGNTELTYYKDGYGFTSVTVHKETPDGEPLEETRKLHRIIYEGQVDVINGTGLIYRGESGTQYDPPEQISFTPIEVSTDEGENTLYADEGNSAIVYRKEST